MILGIHTDLTLIEIEIKVPKAAPRANENVSTVNVISFIV